MAELRNMWTFAGLPVYDPAILIEQLRAISDDLAGNNGGLSDLQQPIDAIEAVTREANHYRTARGKEPGTGKILMTRRDVAGLLNPERPIHTLAISDGVRFVNVQNLFIVQATAVYPGVLAERAARVAAARRAARTKTGQTLVQAIGESLYLVEIADARWYAARYSSIARAYNVCDIAFGRPETPHDTYICSRDDDGAEGRGFFLDREQTIAAIFDGGIGTDFKKLFFDRAIVVDEPTINDIQEDLRFDGMNAWDALNFTVADSGMHFITRFDGTAAVVNDVEENKQQKAINTAVAGGLLVDTTDPVVRHGLPENVRIYMHEEDYQWYQQESERPTAQDFWRRSGTRESSRTVDGEPDTGTQSFTKPVFVDILFSKELLKGTDAARFAIIRGGSLEVWSSHPWITDDTGALGGDERLKTYREDVERDNKRLATQRLLDVWNETNIQQWDFAGVFPAEPDGYLSSVEFFDYGWGTTTRLIKSRCDKLAGIGDSWNLGQATYGPPAIQRDRQPYGREAWAELLGPFPEPTPSAFDDPSFPVRILPNVYCRVSIMSGHRREPSPGEGIDDRVTTEWRRRHETLAINTTGETLRMHPSFFVSKPDLFMRWNYQVGRAGGEWCIVRSQQVEEVKGAAVETIPLGESGVMLTKLGQVEFTVLHDWFNTVPVIQVNDRLLARWFELEQAYTVVSCCPGPAVESEECDGETVAKTYTINVDGVRSSTFRTCSDVDAINTTFTLTRSSDVALFGCAWVSEDFEHPCGLTGFALRWELGRRKNDAWILTLGRSSNNIFQVSWNEKAADALAEVDFGNPSAIFATPGYNFTNARVRMRPG